jgi:hypothetical protein
VAPAAILALAPSSEGTVMEAEFGSVGELDLGPVALHPNMNITVNTTNKQATAFFIFYPLL